MGIPPPLPSVAAAAVTIFFILALFFPIQCGSTILRPESRVLGGVEVEEGEFPHQALMRIQKKGGDELCGGSILRADYILLAAHCVINVDPLTIFFGVGKHDIGLLVQKDYYRSAEVIIHPCYDQERKNEHGYDLNDIAIVKLKERLPLNTLPNIKAIQIDKQNLAIADDKATLVIGWGISHNLTRLKLSKARFQVITPLVCKTIDDKINPDGQICAFNFEALVCERDSGGPLLCDDGKGNFTSVCGIASLVHKLDPNQTDCSGSGVFTRVYHYRDWIESVLAGNRNSSEGCLPEPDLPETTTEPEPEPEPKPEPKPKPTPKPKPKPEAETTESDEYDELSRGFPSYRPSRLICGIGLILTFLSLW